jgi:hypothetical protein
MSVEIASGKGYGCLWGSSNRSDFDEEFFTIHSWFDHVTKLQ